MNIALRPITSADMEFLYRVYASTREEELSVVDWAEEQKTLFLKMQFEAQHQHYQKYFPDTAFDIITTNRIPVGRLYLDRRVDEIRIVDIALLAEYRGQGIGTTLLMDILTEGQNAGLPVRIHVERNNPALSLYHRLGFKEIEEQGVYWLMEWTPET